MSLPGKLPQSPDQPTSNAQIFTAHAFCREFPHRAVSFLQEVGVAAPDVRESFWHSDAPTALPTLYEFTDPVYHEPSELERSGLIVPVTNAPSLATSAPTNAPTSAPTFMPTSDPTSVAPTAAPPPLAREPAPEELPDDVHWPDCLRT